ncbi:D-amino acid aminotransferase [Ectothiorhodospiraceae bacterium BW-2]|nr:D-amino acid aminotransferase [Ectothiorhodospiraceae bacterium BW-2]
MAQIYLNGQWQEGATATVSILDRGFIFGDGIYEMIAVYAGVAFELDAHLQRLESSLASVRITAPLNREGFRALMAELIERNGGGNQAIYLQLTRGVAPRDHRFPVPEGAATLLLMSSPLPQPPPIATAVTADDSRWHNCHIKTINLLANVLLRQQAIESGASEAILLREGYLTEGAASNIFIVTDQTVATPPKSCHILPGITRQVVLDLAHQAGISVEERQISRAQLLTADEIWMTSSTKEIVPVVRVDGAAVGRGEPGPMWHQLKQQFQTYKQQQCGLCML